MDYAYIFLKQSSISLIFIQSKFLIFLLQQNLSKIYILERGNSDLIFSIIFNAVESLISFVSGLPLKLIPIIEKFIFFSFNFFENLIILFENSSTYFHFIFLIE